MLRFLLCLLVALIALRADLSAASLTGPAAGSDLLITIGLAGGALVLGTLLATTALTLVDIAKRLDPNDQVARIIELLAQTNQILEDMPFLEGNLTTGHRTTVRTGLPTPTWRLLNGGVLPTKSVTAQIDEHCGMLEDWSQVDQAVAELGGNPGAVRLSEARAHLEGMNQEAASTIFYGSAVAPAEFIGLAARYAALTGAGNSDNVISAGGTGSTDNTSMYLIQWDPETITGIYPKGSKAGLGHDDLGLDTVENAGGVTGALMRAYRDRWTWHLGIALKDWRHVVRVCNIDVSNLGSASDAADLLFFMADAEERLPNNMGKRAWYANRTVRRYLRHQMTTKVGNGGGLTFDNVAGKRVMFFGETPVRVTDALLNTEDVVA